MANLFNNFAQVTPHKPLVSLPELEALRLLICKMTLFSICDLYFCTLQQFVPCEMWSILFNLLIREFFEFRFAKCTFKFAKSLGWGNRGNREVKTTCCKMQKYESQMEMSVILQINNRKASNSESDTSGLCGVTRAKLLNRFVICEKCFQPTVVTFSAMSFSCCCSSLSKTSSLHETHEI